jgi:hypothetical protein
LFDDEVEAVDYEFDSGAEEDVLDGILQGSDEEGQAVAKRVQVRKKAKVVKNVRESLHSWHKFADYKPSQLPKGAKGVKLSGEWTKLFQDAKDAGLAIGCGNCLWAVSARKRSTVKGMEMHLLCPGFRRGGQNVVTDIEWLTPVTTSKWTDFVNTAVLKWEKEDDPLEDDVSYFRDLLAGALVHKDEFVTWLTHWRSELGMPPITAEAGKGAARADKASTGVGREGAALQFTVSNPGTASNPVVTEAVVDRSGTVTEAVVDRRGTVEPATASMSDQLLLALEHIDVVIGMLELAVAASSTTAATEMLKGAARHVLDAQGLTNPWKLVCFLKKKKMEKMIMRNVLGSVCAGIEGVVLVHGSGRGEAGQGSTGIDKGSTWVQRTMVCAWVRGICRCRRDGTAGFSECGAFPL